jgi:hypothetical protein
VFISAARANNEYSENGNVYVYARNAEFWTANTTFPISSNVYFGGNVYQVTGNTYSSNFANISANVNPVWTANTVINSEFVLFNNNTYSVTGNVYAQLWDQVLLESGNVKFAFSGNTAVTQLASGLFTVSQVLSSQTKNAGALFGSSIDCDRDGDTVFIGAPGLTIDNFPQGQVEQYIRTGNTYAFKQNISNPLDQFSRKLVAQFGFSVSVTDDTELLAIGSLTGPGESGTIFDNNTTVIDTSSTRFIDFVLKSGAVFLFENIIDQSNLYYVRLVRNI